MNAINNAVTLIGNLGKDIEIFETSNGKKIGRTSVATSSSYKNEKGETVQNTQWHNIIAWNKTAELMEKVLKKGSKVVLKGELVNNSYKNKEGRIVYTTNVCVNEFQNLSPKEALPF